MRHPRVEITLYPHSRGSMATVGKQEINQVMQQEMTIVHWLFNPFVRIAGTTSLVFGLGAIVLGGLVAAAVGIRFDGLLDMHFVGPVPLWLPVLEGVLNWIVISLLIAGVARAFGGASGVRLIDIAGTQAMARTPLLLSVAICSLPWIRNSLAELATSLQDSGVAAPDVGPGVRVGSLIMMAGIAWMIVLMWNAFTACCHIKGGRGIAMFVGAVVIGEVITKGVVVRFL